MFAMLISYSLFRVLRFTFLPDPPSELVRPDSTLDPSSESELPELTTLLLDLPELLPAPLLELEPPELLSR